MSNTGENLSEHDNSGHDLIPLGGWRRSVSLNSREYQIYLATRRRRISLRQANAQYEEEHPQSTQLEEVSPSLHTDTATEKSHRTRIVRVYRFHKQGTPAPSSATGPMQYYRYSEAVQISPKDKPENLSGSSAEERRRTATYHATYVSVEEEGRTNEEYWGVMDQRGDHFKVPISSDYHQRYSVLEDFAEQRIADQAGADTVQDIAIFID